MILLASGSPRRKELLETLGLDFQVIPASIDESLIEQSDQDPVAKARQLAKQKAEALKHRVEFDAILAADTIVHRQEEILSKPADREDAFHILKKLAGKTHRVTSAIHLISLKQSVAFAGYRTTLVSMRNYSDSEIESYIKTGEPMDKAGAYGIQGHGARLVDSIQGDYLNVVGMSAVLLIKILNRAGITVAYPL